MRVERLQREFPVDVDWVPFELHPDTPVEGTQFSVPAGSQRAAAADYLKQLAAEAGLTMQRGGRVSNSRLALEAAEFARDAGPDAFHAFHHAVLRAYFEDGRDIGPAAELQRIAGDAGLDAAALGLALEDRRYAARVDAFTAWARENGIHSTPSFVFDSRMLLPGAQDYSVFADVATRLLARKQPS